jgi:hypothetical protein
MNRSLGNAFIGSAILLSLGLTVFSAAAQDAVTPAPDPVVTAPAAPASAQETYDEVSVTQLMKIAELSRLIGGGITQLFSSVLDQKQALDLIRDAQTGPKTFPVLNGPAEAEERQGGPGLKDMADAALEGFPTGPSDMVDTLARLRNVYHLDKAFALKDDESISKQMIANASAQGAVAASMADTSYKRANASMARLDGYIAALESSADLKTSVDINTRVMIEVAQQLNESLRTQAALASTAGAYFMIMGGETGRDDDLAGMQNFNR